MIIIRRAVQNLPLICNKKKGCENATLPQINPLMPPNEEQNAVTNQDREVLHLRKQRAKVIALHRRHAVILDCLSAP